jgi:gliding motility-associated-like protein
MIVTQPPQLSWGVTSSTHVGCYGGSDGTIHISAAGGSGLITYTLLPTNTTNTIGTFNGLSANVYTIQATDVNGCSIITTVSITQPLPLVIDSITNSVPTCLPGSLSVYASGGTNPYLFSIDGVSFLSNNVFTNLPAGIYTLTVKDAHSCTVTSSHTMTVPNAPFITNLISTNATCNGSNNGSISNITANGGAGSYVFSVLPSGSFTNLSPNTYTVIVSDANSCTSSTTLTITEPPAISLVSLTHTHLSCHNLTDGSIHISCIGGTGTLHYKLLPQNISNLSGNFLGLAGNTYTIVVTDDSNCVYTTTQTIINPPSLIFTSVSSSPISCNGNTNASIVVISSGGTGSPAYSISPALSPNNTTGIFSSLSANSYTVTVIDSNNCSRDTLVSIIQPPPVIGSFLLQQNVSCYGGSNGAFTVFANAGWAPITYYLLGTTVSNSTGIFNNMPAGTYSVQLVDSAFCSTIISPIIVSQPAPLVWDSVINPLIPCHGDITDLVKVFASGGTGTKTFSISPLGPQNNTSGQFAGLASQVYTVTAKDANNCIITTLINVTQNPDINFSSLILHPPKCYGDKDGSIVSTIFGGIPPLNYQLNGPPITTTSNFTNLAAGVYTLTVQDALLCKTDTILNLEDPDKLALASLDVGSVICPDSSDAEIHIKGVGGTGNLKYCLMPDSVSNSSGNFYFLPTGTYTLIIKDSLNCSIDSTVFVSPPLNPMSISISSYDLGCFGLGTEGWAEANVIGGAHPYSYLWNTTPPQFDMRATDLRFGYYIVQVTDFKGCNIWDTVYIKPGTCCEEVFLPNAFSPNGDGVNDIFRAVTSAGIQLIYFKVYNRWGELMWSTNDYTKGWDGSFNGEDATNNSTYYFMFSYKCLTDGRPYVKKGDVILIR